MTNDPLPQPGYFILEHDREHVQQEIQRQTRSHRLLTRTLGGLFPEGRSLAPGARVLDVACGAGDWAQAVARANPSVEITGVELNPSRVAHAARQASAQGLTNVSFVQGDVRLPLPFPARSFDLINARLLQGVMPRECWSSLLAECARLLHSGGMVRLTECENTISTSLAFERLSALHTQALSRAGYSVSPHGSHIGITAVLAAWLREAGFTSVGSWVGAIDFSTSAEAHDEVLAYFQSLLPLVLPFWEAMGVTSGAQAEQLIAAALAEMMRPTFAAIWYYRTVWGQHPA